jgi:hypothetical protein
MTPSSRWIRALAVWFCGGATIERLVDPILADVELEYRDQALSGRVWLARWVLVRGYAGFCSAVALHAAHVYASAWRHDDAAKQTLRISVGAFVVVTFAFVLPPLLTAPMYTRYPDLAIYLVPQAIPLSMPIALSFIACGWSRRANGRGMLRRVFVLGVAGALMSLATLEWLVPAGNQAWRVGISRRLAEAGHSVPPTILRGINERSLSELAALVRKTTPLRPFSATEYEKISADLRDLTAGTSNGRDLTAHDLQLAFHARVAMCFATAALSLLAVAAARALARRSLARTVFAGLVLLYAFAWDGVAAIANTLPPAASAWLPNAAVVSVSIVWLAIGARPRQVRAI